MVVLDKWENSRDYYKNNILLDLRILLEHTRTTVRTGVFSAC